MTHLPQLVAVTTALCLHQQTLFGPDLDQQGLQVGEDLIVGELTHPHHPLGSIHVAHSYHSLAVRPGGVAYCHHTGTALSAASTTKQNLLELGQVSRGTLGRRHRGRRVTASGRLELLAES